MPPESFINSDSDLESIISQDHNTQQPPRRNSIGPKYWCPVEDCGASFKRLDHLDRHEFYHTGIKKHACTYEGCDKKYSILTHLKRHLRTTHERVVESAKTIPCEIDSCKKLFTSASNMQRHMREVHENPKAPYCCAHCGEKFTQKLKMRRHEIAQHTRVYPYNCTKCAKGFLQKWQCERHLPTCKVYPCPTCTLQFEKWTLYVRHCKETQHGRKYYQCEHCPRLYAKPSELQKHVAVKHLDAAQQMLYTCTHEGCKRAYAYERNLRQHVRTAHGGKRFECLEAGCERVFSSRQNLAKHMARDHCGNDRREAAPNVLEQKAKKRSKHCGKSVRKKRKDAGRAMVSNLAKLSGLAVDKQLDELLRKRETDVLDAVLAKLLEEPQTDIEPCTLGVDTESV